MNTNKQYPIACQEIFSDLKTYYPTSFMRSIVDNSSGISIRRVQGVFSGEVTDPKKIIQIARIAVKIIRKTIDPSYAQGRKIVLKTTTPTKTKR